MRASYLVGPELFELWEDKHGRTVTWTRVQACRSRGLIVGRSARAEFGRVLRSRTRSNGLGCAPLGFELRTDGFRESRGGVR